MKYDFAKLAVGECFAIQRSKNRNKWANDVTQNRVSNAARQYGLRNNGEKFNVAIRGDYVVCTRTL